MFHTGEAVLSLSHSMGYAYTTQLFTVSLNSYLTRYPVFYLQNLVAGDPPACSGFSCSLRGSVCGFRSAWERTGVASPRTVALGSRVGARLVIS